LRADFLRLKLPKTNPPKPHLGHPNIHEPPNKGSGLRYFSKKCKDFLSLFIHLVFPMHRVRKSLTMKWNTYIIRVPDVTITRIFYRTMCKQNLCIFWKNIEDKDPHWGARRHLGSQNMAWVDPPPRTLNEKNQLSKHRKPSIVYI